MPARPEGVYSDGRGGWYFKVTVGRDPLTGRRDQITRRGFRTASEAAKARRQVEAGIDSGRLKPSPAGMTVNELMELYLELAAGEYLVVGAEDAEPAVAEVVDVRPDGVVLLRVLDGPAKDHLGLVRHASAT